MLGTGWQTSALAKAPRTGFAALPKQQQATLDELEKRTFEFFRDSTNAANGQVPDHWPPNKDGSGDYFSSIAAVGFGLTAYGIGVERGWMTRAEAAKRTLVTLKFFHDAAQSDAPDATGNHGFFYHFLDMNTGTRYHARRWVELSTIDTTLLLGGVLFSESYYDRNSRDEKEIRRLADEIFRGVDWQWASPRPPLVAMGWTPESGFDPRRLAGLRRGHAAVRAGAGFTDACGRHRPRGKPGPRPTTRPGAAFRDRNTWDSRRCSDINTAMSGSTSAESRTTTCAIAASTISPTASARRSPQREYAIHNPMQWTDYGANIWGLTACNGPRRDMRPGEIDRYAKDVKTFYGYIARGAGLRGTIDDGTIAPTAAVSSIAFVPEIVIPAVEEMKQPLRR